MYERRILFKNKILKATLEEVKNFYFDSNCYIYDIINNAVKFKNFTINFNKKINCDIFVVDDISPLLDIDYYLNNIEELDSNYIIPDEVLNILDNVELTYHLDGWEYIKLLRLGKYLIKYHEDSEKHYYILDKDSVISLLEFIEENKDNFNEDVSKLISKIDNMINILSN